MKILDYIPHGKENAVSRESLANLYGGGERGDRKARKAIEIARKTQVILNLQDGSGYFQPMDTDSDLVAKQFKQVDNRAKAVSRQRRAIKKWQREHSGQMTLEV